MQQQPPQSPSGASPPPAAVASMPRSSSKGAVGALGGWFSSLTALARLSSRSPLRWSGPSSHASSLLSPQDLVTPRIPPPPRVPKGMGPVSLAPRAVRLGPALGTQSRTLRPTLRRKELLTQLGWALLVLVIAAALGAGLGWASRLF